MKIKTENNDFHSAVGVAKASKTIKKKKAEEKVSKLKKEKKSVPAEESPVSPAKKKTKYVKESGNEASSSVNGNGTEKNVQPKTEVKLSGKKKKGIENGKKTSSKANSKLAIKTEAAAPPLKKKTKLAESAEQQDATQPDRQPTAGKMQSKKPKKPKAIPDDEQIETSESETDDEDSSAEGDAAKADAAEVERKPEKIVRGKAYTVFIGNLPPTARKSVLKGLFNKYGKILSIRYRTSTGQKLSSSKDFKKADIIYGYIRFANKEEVQKACEMDGQIVLGNRIRVCPGDVKQMGSVRSTVFVGNLRKGTTDNELYEFFEPVGPIEYVRQLSERCVAFVCFKKGVSIVRALKMNEKKLNNRPVRVTRVDPTRTNMKKNKKGHLVKRNRLPGKNGKQESDGNKAKKADDFHGNVVTSGAAIKKKSKKQHRGEKAKKIISQKLKAAMTTTKK